MVLVGQAPCAEGYGPVRLTADQIAERRRRWGTDTAPPIAVVTLTGNLPTSLFIDPDRPPILVTTAQLIRSRPELADPADVVIAGESVVDIGAAVAALRRRGLRRILCEGGPTLLEELIARDLVDEMCLTISPTLAAAPATARVGASRVPTRMALRHAVRIDDYVYLRYVRPGGGPDRKSTRTGATRHDRIRGVAGPTARRCRRRYGRGGGRGHRGAGVGGAGPRPPLRVPSADGARRSAAGRGLRQVALGRPRPAADRLAEEMVGRNVLHGRWTFQIVEEFDDNYWSVLREHERSVRAELTGGARHVYEAEMKDDRRTRGRPGHEAAP